MKNRKTVLPQSHVKVAMPLVEAPKNAPEVLLPLSASMADFIVENCDANISFGLQKLMAIESQDLAQKMVDHLEMFKSLKKVTEQALKDSKYDKPHS